MEKILSYLTTEQQEIPFVPLDRQDIKALKDTAKFDLDYLCLIETGTVLFSNDATLTSFGQNNCNIYRKCMAVKIRSENCFKGFIIGDLGAFKVALISTTVIDDEDFEEILESDTEEPQVRNTSTWNRSTLNALLEREKNENCSYRVIQEFINNNFGNENIAVFPYGQKLDINIANQILSSFSKVALVEVALAVECHLNGYS